MSWSYSIEQMNQLANALKKWGFTPNDVTNLGQLDDSFELRGLSRGTHEIRVKTLCRKVSDIDRTLTPEQVLEPIANVIFDNGDLIKTIPNGDGCEATLFFFFLDHWIDCNCNDELNLEYANRGLVPCDPYALAKANKDDPMLQRNCPNCTLWKNDSNEWLFIRLYFNSGERRISIHRFKEQNIPKGTWLAGVARSNPLLDLNYKS